MTTYGFSWIAKYLTPYQKAPKACLSFRFRNFNPEEMTTYGFYWMAKYLSLSEANPESNDTSLNKGSGRCLAMLNNSQATKRALRRMTKGKKSAIPPYKGSERSACVSTKLSTNADKAPSNDTF